MISLQVQGCCMFVNNQILQEGRTEVLGDLLQRQGQRGERGDDKCDADAVLRLRHAGQEGLRVRPVGRQDGAVLGDGRLVQQEGVVDAPDVGQQRPALRMQKDTSAQMESMETSCLYMGCSGFVRMQAAGAAQLAGASEHIKCPY